MERLSMIAATNRAIVGEPAPRFSSKGLVDGRIREILAFDGRLSEFTSRDCTVIFVSTDSELVLQAWSASDKEGGLGGTRVPLMSDRSHRISRDYGVLIEEDGVPQRATFIIDPSGMIRSSSINDANIGRSVDETKRLLNALKFTDEYGEACPVDWKPGQRGIKMATLAHEVDSEKQLPSSGIRPNLNRGMSWTTGWVKAPTTPKSPRTGGAVDDHSKNGRPRSVLWGGDYDPHGEILVK